MDRIDYLKNTKYPAVDPTIIDAAVLSDPTPEKKFADWIIRMIVKSGLKQNEFSNITSIISVYNSVRNRMPAGERDINRFSSPLELSASVMKFINEDTNQKPGNPLIVYDKIYEDEQWFVIRPHTFEASAKYSKSTKWCTTAKGTFHSYMAYGYLYVVINKKLPDGYPEAKLQFCFSGHNSQFMNALNEPVSIIDFFQNNKPIWEEFKKAKEFESGKCKFLKLIHDDGSENIDQEAQMSGFQWFGFQVFNILKNPCSQLQKQAIKTIVTEKQNWSDLKRIGRLSPSVQNDLIDIAIEYDKKSNIVQQSYSELSNIESIISEDVKLKFVKHCPESVYFIDNPSDEVMEIALSSHPDLIKRKIDEYKEGLIKRKWLTKMATKVPDILKYFDKTVEFSIEDTEKIINSTNFDISSHIKYFKVVPEKIQLNILRKHGVEYYRYFKNPTDKVRIAYKKIKKRSEAKARIIQKRIDKKSPKDMMQILVGNGFLFQTYDGKWAYKDRYGNYEIQDAHYEAMKVILQSASSI